MPDESRTPLYIGIAGLVVAVVAFHFAGEGGSYTAAVLALAARLEGRDDA